MRKLLLSAFLLISTLAVSAATLEVEVRRQGFEGPIRIDVAPRIDGRLPEWVATQTLTPNQSRARFRDLPEGLYVVLASGPQPLQRLSTKANLGADGRKLRLLVPRSKGALQATMAGEPLPHAAITLTHDELRWTTELATGEDGRFTGDLWEPGLYTVTVARDLTAAPHRVDVRISEAPFTIEVPDRHIRGRILGADGAPLADAVITLRSENSESILSMRTASAPDGRFEFFGVREGAQTVIVRAPSYVDSDAVRFDLQGPTAVRSVDVQLSRGEPRAVRVIDSNGRPIAGAAMITSCNGEVKSVATTSAEGSAEVALPTASCAVYVLPKEGSLAIRRFVTAEPLLIRMPEGSSSLHLALKSESGGEPFADLRLLMRVDGEVIPPEIARLLAGRGLSLTTNAEGTLSLQRIPAGTYEFWPYRSTIEGQMLYESVADQDAPISLTVLAGENNATIRFQAR